MNVYHYNKANNKDHKKRKLEIPEGYHWQSAAKKPILNWNSFVYCNSLQILIIEFVLSNEVRLLFQVRRKGITCIYPVWIVCTHQFFSQDIFAETSIWNKLNRKFQMLCFTCFQVRIWHVFKLGCGEIHVQISRNLFLKKYKFRHLHYTACSLEQRRSLNCRWFLDFYKKKMFYGSFFLFSI